MKILHTGDIHLGELTGPVKNGVNSRMATTISIMNDIAVKARQEDVDAIIVAGDLFDRAKLWQDEAMQELQLAAQWLRDLTAAAPTLLLFGTPNHDNPHTFEMINKLHIDRLHVIKTPEIIKLETKSGLLQIAGVPGLEKNNFRAKLNGLSVTEENEFCTNAIRDIILGLGAQIDKNIPSVLTSHYTVVGAEISEGDHVFKANEIVIHQDALTATPFNLVCLGHIHRPQKVLTLPPAYYCGSPNRISFNEEKADKGFWIHDIIPVPIAMTYSVESTFHNTAADAMLTLHLDKDQLQTWINKDLTLTDLEKTLSISFNNKLVRILYEAYESDNTIFNKAEMQKEIEVLGGYLHEIILKRKVILTDKRELETSKTPETALNEYLDGKEITPEEKQEIMSLAEPIIAAATANTVIGSLTGVFEPVRLTVKNYRSYRQQTFDFGKICFATVNGENGIGKSAFFMDAIADCLYEEPRDGDIKLWINSDEDVKSGSMSFEFKIGETLWRVTRTRGKRSKASLNISEYVNDEWVDRSCEKMNDTQEKIIKLIGMDSATFKSCALIMQDNYGTFLETKKKERIQVLSDILGLDIYTELEKLVRSAISDCNKDLNRIKDKLSDINTAGEDITTLQTEEANTVDNSASCDGFISDFKIVIDELNKEKDTYEQCHGEVLKLTNEIEDLNSRLSAKKAKKDELTAKQEKAQKIIDNEPQINEKVTYYENQKSKLTELKARLESESELNTRFLNAEVDLSNYESKEKDLQIKLTKVREDISQYESFRETAASYDKEKAKLDKLCSDKEKATSYEKELLNIDAKARSINSNYDMKIQQAKSELASYKRKAEILNNSNCIDIDNAECLFLKDAVEANKAIPETENRLNNLEHEKSTNEELKQIEARKHEIQTSVSEINFSIQVLLEQEKLVATALEARNKISLLEGMYQNVNDYETQLSEVKSFIEKTKLELSELKKKKESFVTLHQQLQEITSETESIEARKWLNAKDLLPVSKEIVSTSLQQIQEVDADIENLSKQIADKSLDKFDKESSAAFNWPKEEEKQKDLITAKEKLIQYEKARNDFLVALGTVKEKIKTALENQGKAKALIAEQNTAAEKKAILNKQLEAFSPDGIPFNIIRSVVPEIEATANHILSQMTGGSMSLSMKTDRIQESNKKEVNCLEIMISDLKHGTLPYLSKSGGQKVKAALAVAFALAEIKSTRAGIQLGMLFIDEPPFLDEQGTQAYCDALETISQRYKDMKVVAITHDRAMKARFGQVLEVIATDEGSKVIFA